MPDIEPSSIIHRDGELLVVSKPAGLPVIPARGEPPESCLQKELEARLGERLFVVHRIDRDTSGLVVFARNAEAHRRLSMAFERREVSKRYLAFVIGSMSPESGRIETALHTARRGKMRPALPDEPGGLEAVTEYSIRQSWSREGSSVSLVEARPLSGRQHQIRVHLRSVGAPVLNDPIYGGVPKAGPLTASPCHRLALHAWRLVLPREGAVEPLELEAPLAPDLEALQRWLDTDWQPGPGGERA